jgi:hypothetical protein
MPSKAAMAEVLQWTAAAILVTGLALAFPVFSAHQEAAAYNRISNGPHVTTWEALFLELRVEACNSQR